MIGNDKDSTPGKTQKGESDPLESGSFAKNIPAVDDLIILSGVSIKSPTGKELIKDFSISVGPKSKLALIGMEGVGKSTLLRLMAGQKIDPFTVEGHVSSGNVAYLPQSFPTNWLGLTTIDYFLRQAPDQDIEVQAWEKYGKVGKCLSEVGLDQSFLDKDLSTLSGGELVRVSLAKLLLEEPKILLLDEPTNHLDLRTIRWLQDFIQSSKVGIVFVSHDELLISKCASSLCHLHYVDHLNKAEYSVSGTTYEEFLEERSRAILKSEKQADAQKNRLQATKRRLIELREKSGSRAAKNKPEDAAMKGRARRGAANATAQISRVLHSLENEERVEVKNKEEPINMLFPPECTMPGGKLVLDLELRELKAGDKTLAKNLKINVSGPEKVAIIGDNGVGKSTLLRLVHGQLIDKPSIRVGYMPQKYYEGFSDTNQLAIDFLRDTGADLTTCRTMLAQMNFVPQEVNNKVSELSGGQSAKLYLIKMILQGCNVLLLDEPTTNLSPLSTPVLREALQQFNGAIIAVSHDRMFIDQVSTRILELTKSRGLVLVPKSEICSLWGARMSLTFT